MSVLRAVGIAIALVFVVGAAAKDGPIDEGEWLALIDGKTVHYSIGGRPLGREYYPPGEPFSIYQTAEGSCVEGPFAYTDGHFCFWYGERFQCFEYYRRGNAIYSRADTGGKEIKIDRIVKGSNLSCSR